MARLRDMTIAALLCVLPALAGEPQGHLQQQGQAELLALHQADRRAHFSHDVAALLSHTAPQLLDVRDGTVKVMTHDELKAKFDGYFRRAEFAAWDDVQPAVVHISADGHSGWMVVQVRITYFEKDASGKRTEHRSTAAWMSAYEKRAGTWLMTAVTSTSDER